MEDLLGVLGFFAGFVIVLFIIVIGIYIAQAIFLNKFNKLIYGKGTAMAWIPIANIYLLGKLTINKMVGWILVICSFSTATITTTVNGVETTHTILPESINSIISPLYSLTTLGLFIYAIVKYYKIKNNNNAQVTSNIPQQTLNNQTENISNQPQEQINTPNETINQNIPNQINNLNMNNQNIQQPQQEIYTQQIQQQQSTINQINNSNTNNQIFQQNQQENYNQQIKSQPQNITNETNNQSQNQNSNPFNNGIM